MAYSPAPVSPTVGPGPSSLNPHVMSSHARNRSLSPPSHPHPHPHPHSQPQQPLSKRDKRRGALHERLHDLTDSFSNNRDYHFRQQVHSLQNEISLISNSQLYGVEPISDAPEDIAKHLEQLAATGHLVPEAIPSGRWYAKFIQEMNVTKEERDLELTVVMNRHRDNVSRIKREHDFRTHFAAEEYNKLGETIRERLVQSIAQRKNRLMREKEQLDIADTNALLLHPNQFSITNPSSPGGLQSNRKTRHTRHRVDIDEMGNGISSDAVSKRKRKAPMDEDGGSPVRDAGIITPAERNKARSAAQQNASAYNIFSLFTEKELAMYSNTAHVATLHFLAASKRARQMPNATGGTGTSLDAEDASGSGEGSGQEDNAGGSGAVDMERTTSQGYHVTRSTRTNGTSGLTLLGELSEKAATRPNLPYAILGNYHSRPNGGSLAPPPPALMPEEIEDDFAKIEKLSSKPPGWIDQKLVNELAESSAMEYEREPLVGASYMRFGTLHPDFPPEMDVHMVRLQPQDGP